MSAIGLLLIFAIYWRLAPQPPFTRHKTCSFRSSGCSFLDLIFTICMSFTSGFLVTLVLGTFNLLWGAIFKTPLPSISVVLYLRLVKIFVLLGFLAPRALTGPYTILYRNIYHLIALRMYYGCTFLEYYLSYMASIFGSLVSKSYFIKHLLLRQLFVLQTEEDNLEISRRSSKEYGNIVLAAHILLIVGGSDISIQFFQAPTRYVSILNERKKSFFLRLISFGHNESEINAIWEWLNLVLKKAQNLLSLAFLIPQLRLLSTLLIALQLSEFPNKIRPPCTTMPWAIVPALFVLWGVCWMFYDEFSNSSWDYFNSDNTQDNKLENLFDYDLYSGRFEDRYSSPAVPQQQPQIASTTSVLTTIEGEPNATTQIGNDSTSITSLAGPITSKPYRQPALTQSHQLDTTITSGEMDGNPTPSQPALICDHEACKGRTFSYQSHLKKHVDRHNRPFSCSECEQQFGAKKDLERHQETKHMESNDFFCTEPGCKRSNEPFNRKDNLLKHMQNVHQQKAGTRSKNLLSQDETPAISPTSKKRKRNDEEADILTREELLERLLEEQSRNRRLQEAMEEQSKKFELELRTQRERYEKTEDRLWTIIQEKQKGQ